MLHRLWRPTYFLQRRRASTKLPNTFIASDPITHLKSSFQGYASRCAHIEKDQPNLAAYMKSEVLPRLLERIQEAEPRTRRASHAMYAWRVRRGHPPASPTFFCGSSNGGEAGAGERLEKLLELGRCEDTIVVVFRWYGGVKLGSDRWRCISAVAKEALERGGCLAEAGSDGISRGGKKKRR